MSSATLTKQVKDIPPGTEVNLVGISDGIATIKVNGKSLLIPASYIQQETKPLLREYAQINHELKVTEHMKTVKTPALKAYEVTTHSLNISCRCGKLTRCVSVGKGWLSENQAIDNIIKECGACNG